MARRLYVLGFLAALASGVAYAEDLVKLLEWGFTIDNPIQFSPTQVELMNGTLRLKPLDQSDSSKNNFAGATFSNTFWDAQNQWVSVAGTLTLPNGAVPQSDTAWADMTGNALLLHGDTSVIFSGTTKTFPDSSGKNNAPTCAKNACPQTDAGGQLGSAVWFDGKDDFLTVPGAWGGTDWTEATIESWIRVDGKTADMQAIVSSTNANMFIHLQMLQSGDKFNAAIYADKGSSVVGFDATAPGLAIGTWHHVAVSTKPGEVVLYADGAKVGSAKFSYTYLQPVGSGQEFRIGSGYGKTRFFKGALDEVAVYKRALPEGEIKAHYDQQSKQFVGSFNSRIIGVGSPVDWTSLTWLPVGPNGVQLPDNATNESGYVAGNVNMSGNILLTHLNEASGTEFADSSGQTNKGSCTGAGCPTLGGDGKFATAAEFDGVDDQISIPSSASVNVTAAVTVEAWIYPKAMPDIDEGAGIVSKGNNGNDARYELLAVSRVSTTFVGGMTAFWRLANHSTVDPNSGGSVPYAVPYVYGGNMPLNAWSHVVGTYNGSVISLYVNGVQVASQPMTGGPITTDNNPLFIGVRQNQSGYTGKSHFKGRIDEVAVYNRALAPDEVLSRYLRGALQPKFQVRSCDKDNCLGVAFTGPGNSEKTYYTPSAVAVSPQQTATLSGVIKNPYFQYRVYFDSKDASLFPAIKSVDVGPSHYPSIPPSVVIPTGQQYAVLSSFSDVMGDDNTGEVRYQLSPNGEDWYFCYGTQWQKTTEPLVMTIPELGELQKTNSAAKVNVCAPSFGTAAGEGKVFIKAFLFAPTAKELVALKQLKIGYELTPPAAPPPPPPTTTVLSDIPTITVAEGGTLSLTMDASKAGLKAPFQYLCQANCPEGMSIKSDSGEISWKPTYQQAGKYADVQFKVSDSAGKSATQALSVVVTETKVAPKIVSPGDKVVTAGQNVSFTLTAEDMDGGAPSYQIVSGKQTGMSINESSGLFSWTPTDDQAGAYAVMLRALDDKDPKSFSDQAVMIVVNKSETASVTGTTTESPTSQLPEDSTQTTDSAQPASADEATAGCSLIRSR